MQIAAIMPCRGRADQTVTNVRRLLATAGYDQWRLWCVVSNTHDPGLGPALDGIGVRVAWLPEFSYWQALAYVARQIDADAPYLVNLANDLLPVRHWLRRAVDEYQCCFGVGGDGLMGFNDGIHGADHAPHFLISRRLLEHYGGWPVWYQHNYGDTELCLRAQQDGRYGKAPWAVLYHDHPISGGQQDAVYAEGMATEAADRALFEERRAVGWPRVSR